MIRLMLITGTLLILCLTMGCAQDSEKGDPGPAGSPGLNASSMTIVQLCHGTATYPSVFIEIALCLDNRLYAVYSIPGAFLTYLPPGGYTSIGIGSSCDFRVVAGCVIQ